MKAELLKFANGASLDRFSISFIEIGVAQVLIGLVSSNQVVASDQEGVSNGNDGTLFAASRSQAMILCLKVRMFGATGSIVRNGDISTENNGIKSPLTIA